MERLRAVADLILACPPLAGQAVLRALSIYRRVLGGEPPVLPPSLVLTVLAGESAFSYAAVYRSLTPEKAAALFPGFTGGGRPAPRDMACFLLCADGGLAYGEAAELLGLPLDEVENRYVAACKALALSGDAFLDAVDGLRAQAAAFIPPKPQKQGKGAKGGPARPMRWAAAGFAVLDIAVLLTAAGIFFWSRDFLAPSTPPALAVPQQTAGVTLDALFYTLPIPEGFARTSHLRTEFIAHYEYENGKDTVSFTQQISGQPVTGFDPGTAYEPVSFRGHDAAFLSSDGLSQVYWFNGVYCYTFSTTLPREEALALAETVRMGEPDSLQTPPLHELPAAYPQRLARENGDILIGDFGSENTERIEEFVDHCRTLAPDAIRVTEYRTDGSVTVTDLETKNGFIYCTRDTRRAASGERQEAGAFYRGASISRQGGGRVLFLTSGDWDTPYAALRYR